MAVGRATPAERHVREPEPNAEHRERGLEPPGPPELVPPQERGAQDQQHPALPGA